MAKKISQMTEATEIKSGDISVVVQDGETKQFQLNLLSTKAQADKYKADVETQLADYEQEITNIKNQYDKELYTPTITVTNTSMVKTMVKTGQGDTVDYSASVEDGVAKSAILKGNTLVNIFNNWVNNVGTLTPVQTQDGYFLFTGNNKYARVNLDDIPTFKRGAEYTFIYRIKNSTYDGENDNGLRLDVGAATYVYVHDVTNGIWKIKKTFSTDETNCFVKILSWAGSTGSAEVSLQIIEGDYTNVDIPYFEVMQSVKMPVLTTSNYNNLANNTTIEYGYISGDSISVQKKWLVSGFISIEPNVTYTVRSKGITNDGVFVFAFYDESKNFIVKRTSKNETSPTNAKFVRINVRRNNGNDLTEDEKNGTILYLEKPSEVLPFEEHKSNILSTPEGLELRGIGDVKDTLDLMTGEVVERIGGIVLDGSEKWNYHENLSTDTLAVFSVNNDFGYLEWLGAGSILCDKFPITQERTTGSNPQEGIYDKDGWAGKNKIPLIINKDRLSSVSVEALKSWLANNQLKLQFKLKNKSIKTVVLNPSGTLASETPYM